jgi:hypothetical protein
LRFSLETRECLRVFGAVVRQEFQRHKAMQVEVLRFVNRAHASAAKALHDGILRKGLFKQRIVAAHVLHISGRDQMQASKDRGARFARHQKTHFEALNTGGTRSAP